MRPFILTLLSFLNLSIFAQPVLKLDTNYIDLGKVNYADNLEIIVGFVNSGDDPLILTRVSGDGGSFICSSYPREPIMPGKRGELKFKYDTKRIGEFNKNGWITSNSSPEYTSVVKIKGEVIAIPIAYAAKQNLIFNDEYNGEINYFDLSNTGTKPLVIKRIERIDHVFKLHPEKDTIQVGETIKLSFKLCSYLNNEDFNYTWMLYTNAPDSILKLSAKGKLNYSPLIFYEDTLTKPNGSITKFINLECYNGSSDTVIVDRASFSNTQEGEQIWFPGKEIFWSEGKEYMIAPFQKIKILVAYNLFQTNNSKREIIVSAKNNRSGIRFFNYLQVQM